MTKRRTGERRLLRMRRLTLPVASVPLAIVRRADAPAVAPCSELLAKDP